jgi:hypothetical protein
VSTASSFLQAVTMAVQARCVSGGRRFAPPRAPPRTATGSTTTVMGRWMRAARERVGASLDHISSMRRVLPGALNQLQRPRRVRQQRSQPLPKHSPGPLQATQAVPKAPSGLHKRSQPFPKHSPGPQSASKARQQAYPSAGWAFSSKAKAQTEASTSPLKAFQRPRQALRRCSSAFQSLRQVLSLCFKGWEEGPAQCFRRASMSARGPELPTARG